jgi:hypothetical protein
MQIDRLDGLAREKRARWGLGLLGATARRGNEPLSLGELLVDRAPKRRKQLPLLDDLQRGRRRVGAPIPNRFVDLDLAAPPCEAAKA